MRHRLPEGRRLFVAEVTATLGVATLETLDPVSWSVWVPKIGVGWLAVRGALARQR